MGDMSKYVGRYKAKATGDGARQGLVYSVTFNGQSWDVAQCGTFEDAQFRRLFAPEGGRESLQLDLATRELAERTAPAPEPEPDAPEVVPPWEARLNVRQAIDLIEQTEELDVLREWHAADERLTVRRAITSRIEALEESVKPPPQPETEPETEPEGDEE